MSLPLADVSFFIHGRATKPALLTFLNPYCKTKQKKASKGKPRAEALANWISCFYFTWKKSASIPL